MRLSKILLFFALFLLFLRGTSSVAAQEPVRSESGDFLPSPRVTHLTSEQGLAQNRVYAILQDRSGFMWFGTGNGLSRFDGYTFTTLRYDPENENSPGGNDIRGLMEGRDGELWIGTTEGGLTRYDPLTNTFTRYAHNSNGPPGRRDAGALVATSIAQDEDGGIWFDGLHGGSGNSRLSRLDPATGEVTTIALGAFGGIQDIQSDQTGMIWIAAGRTLVAYDPRTQQATPYTVPEGQLNALLPHPAGGWWLGSSTGLYRFDPESESVVLQNDKIKGITALRITAVGQLWATTNAGLFQLAADSGETRRHFTAIPTEPYSFSENELLSLYQDSAGFVWVGTQNNGVDRFDPDFSRFAFYHHIPSVAGGLAEGSVNAIVGDGATRLWAVTDERLNEIELVPQQVTEISLPADITTLQMLYRDSTGILWVGTGQGQLFRFDPATNTSTPIEFPASPLPQPPPPEEGASLPSQGAPPTQGIPPAPSGEAPRRQITALLELPDGSMLVGVTPSGIYRVALSATTGTRLPIENAIGGEGQSAPIPPEITSFALGADGRVWLGYRGGILGNLDLSTNRLHIRMPFAPLGMIEDVHIDREGTLWLATPRGIAHTTTDGQDLRLYTESDGLPSANIVSIAEDVAGNLWFGTQNGLARLDPATDTIRAFGVGEGVQEREFMRQAVWALEDGRLAFGGRRGLTLFDPTSVESSVAPTVVLTELRLFNDPVIPGTTPLLEQPLWATDSVTFDHDRDIISFEFAALGVPAPETQQYRYQLMGFDPTWSEVDDSRRFATYTNLPAGTYTLRVQAQLPDGTWAEPGESLGITVLPPWWETLWFRGLLLVGVVAGIVVLGRWRVATLRRRNAELEHQVAERTQALADSEARFRGLATSTFEAIILHNGGIIQDANRAAQDLFGYTAEALKGQPIHTLIASSAHTTLESRLRTLSDDPYELEGKTKTGATIPLEVRDREIPLEGQSVRVAALRDLTSRHQIEAQRQQMAALEERERIARDLHDDLGQVIGYVAVQAQAALTRLAQGNIQETNTVLHQLTTAAHDAHEEVRHYITGIRSPAPPADFIEAVNDLLIELLSRYGLRVSFTFPQELANRPLAPEVEAQALRIIQEALTNVYKHAGVAQARLILTLHANEIQLIVADEGRGFAPGNDTTTQATPTHFGLSIMQERAESVGGTLTIHAIPHAGTQVIARLPRLLTPVAESGLGGIRVLVVDDHPLYVEGLRNLLAARGLRVVGVARDGIEAESLALELRPDLILMDVEMPNRNGLEATALIKAAQPDVKIVMLTVAADEEQLVQSIKQGADGYLLKDLESDRFFQMLSDVVRGEMVLSPSLTRRLMSSVATPADAHALAASGEDPILTTRQLEVLSYIARGSSNKEIAAALYISERTVKHHIGLMLERLNLRSRFELARYAQTQGWVKPDTP